MLGMHQANGKSQHRMACDAQRARTEEDIREARNGKAIGGRE